METFLGFMQSLTGFEQETLVGMVKFVGKAILLSVPFLLLGFFFERGVDGSKRLPWSQRVAKVFLTVIFALPLIGFGVFNLVGVKWPGVLEPLLAAKPSLEDLLIMDGVVGPLVLIAFPAVFVLMNAWEMLSGDQSA